MVSIEEDVGILEAIRKFLQVNFLCGRCAVKVLFFLVLYKYRIAIIWRCRCFVAIENPYAVIA